MEFEGIETTDWLTAGMTPEELATEKALTIISYDICVRRIELGWDQKRFAKEMGVSQAMISKWESGDYNFTIETLIKICHKLGLEFKAEIKPKAKEPSVNEKGDGEECASSPEQDDKSSKLARIFKKKLRS